MTHTWLKYDVISVFIRSLLFKIMLPPCQNYY